MTHEEIIAHLDAPAEAPTSIEEQNTYTDDAGHLHHGRSHRHGQAPRHIGAHHQTAPQGMAQSTVYQSVGAWSIHQVYRKTTIESAIWHFLPLNKLKHSPQQKCH